ncbi:MAG: DUF4394 domain-containing protein [Dokdonella sp.]
MKASTFLSRAIPAALLTVLSAGAASQPFPRTSLNKAGPGHSFIFGTAPVKRPAATDGGCAADGLCLAVTLALADSSNPTLCGSATDLAVDIGDQVNICYTVTNNSSTTLNYQSLGDDHVGQLLTNSNVALAPGASYQYNRTITASTNPSSDTGTFTSTWTATDGLPGYSADDTAAYAFVDISATGTGLSLSDDGAQAITLPFAFPFYGTGSTDLCIGNNGELRLGASSCSSSSYNNAALPSTNLNGPAILPYWDDMLPNGTVYYATVGTAPSRQFIVEYQNKFVYGDGGDPTGQTGATWEILLNEADGTVDFQYQTTSFGGAGANYDNGVSATVGLQSNSSFANQYSYGTASLHDGLAITWTPATPISYTATVAATLDVGSPTMITTPDATSGFAPTVTAGSIASAPLLIDNIGNRDLIWSLTPPAADAHFPATLRTAVPFHSAWDAIGLSPDNLRKPGKSNARAPFGTNTVPVYASKVKAGGADFVTFDAADPGAFTTILLDDHALFGVSFVNNDFSTLYGVSYFDGTLYAVSTLDGSSTSIGDTGLVSCCIVSPGGMRWDATTGTTYLVIDDFNAQVSTLYTIDLTTAATTLVGQLTGMIRDIAIDRSGLMYGIDSANDVLVAIDKTNGATQTIGAIGFDAVFGQGLDFDAETGVLYFASASEDESTMYTVDPLTGATTPIGVMGGEVDSMAIAKSGVVCSTSSDTPWLSYDISSGTVTPDPDLAHPATVNVSFDATDLAPGSYTANLCVYGNDLSHSRIAIPVSLTVNPAGPVDEIFQDGFDGSGGGTGGTTAIAQTTDTTPVAQNSAACGDNTAGTTADNQYWRRYYFSEYALPTPASVASVDVSVEQTAGAPNVTVTLYTIPHSAAVDTIDLSQLTQIGQAVVASPANAAMTTLNVPVTGTVTDTTANDLVVEVSTDDGSGDGTAFYIGSTPSAETHPSFLSSTACGISDPTPTTDIGFADMHIIEAVNVDD